MKKLILGLMLLLAGIAGTLYFSPAALVTSMRLVERQLAELDSKQLTVGDLSIHYYEGGPSSGETLLMVHGFGANKDNWLRFARHFTARYHVIALDLPGFGDSSKPQASYDVGTQTERLAAFTAALKIKRLHLIGNSMGGHITALYAARYPQQVASLALFDNGGIDAPRKSEFITRLERGDANPLVVKAPEDFERLLEFVFVEPPPLPRGVKHYLAEQAIANSAHYQQVFEHLVERYIPLEPELPKIQAPTLLLWGEHDRVLDVSSIEVMQALLKQPSVVIMQDCGHAPMIERPQETAAHYQAFLNASVRE
ncbi:alpha/beta fold hydrolase [Pseudomonas sp. UBA2684]|uniref:alpha/beta fold hydrolase n=1 Tax=Pseudomonas sp. UBA2684 TaxID=1947311 RepID=UPI000E94EBC1|nr:alpha/beta hydrolase [Pseudomonas sp. UBA2684]HBX56150.1 alpha/beta hydrolase [Pseudomonas sp.]|tara:strand:+ start:4925 stop:5857 length:933 start_codon:yes stop_codon:yes gene_type:complete